MGALQRGVMRPHTKNRFAPSSATSDTNGNRSKLDTPGTTLCNMPDRVVHLTSPTCSDKSTGR